MASQIWDLQRFIEAQDRVYPRVVVELSAGRKTSHWMWFVFPQMKGLGRSSLANFYGIASEDEAIAYWRHPLLKSRLTECTELMLHQRHQSAHEILGSPDDLKFMSCMTLFAIVLPEVLLFNSVLLQFFEGRRDTATLKLLDRS